MGSKLFKSINDYYKLIRENQQEKLEEALNDPRNLRLAMKACVMANDDARVDDLREKYHFPYEELEVLKAENKAWIKANQYATGWAPLVLCVKSSVLTGDPREIGITRLRYMEPVSEFIRNLIKANNEDRISALLFEGLILPNQVAKAYLNANHHDKVFNFVKQFPEVAGTIAEEYSIRGDDERVKLYCETFDFNRTSIARGYASVNNHAMVQFYVGHYNLDLLGVAQGYKLARNWDKENYYIDWYFKTIFPNIRANAKLNNQSSFSPYLHLKECREEAVKGYAQAGNHAAVRELENMMSGVSPEALIEGYACAENWERVNYYENKYKVDKPTMYSCFARANAHKMKENKIQEFQPANGVLTESKRAISPRNFTGAGAHHYFGKNRATLPIPKPAEREVIVIEDDEPRITQVEESPIPDVILVEPERLPLNEGVIRGGIANKYLNGQIPRLPASASPVTDPSLHKQNKFEFAFTPVNTLGKSASGYRTFPISTPFFRATLLTHSTELNPACHWTFVCAGRKAQAKIPIPKEGRCVLVCTEDELAEVKPFLSSNVDILVVSKLSSETHGEYQELQTITARRLAALFCADYLKLDVFAMLDDNIEKVAWDCETSPDNSWDSLMDYLVLKVSERGCVTVPTLNGHQKSAEELGSKFFMINLGLIRQRLTQERLFFLFPEAKQATKWGEDFYFQIALHNLLKEAGIVGYETLSKEGVGLLRSRQHVNAFAKTGKKAEKFAEMEGLDALEPEFANLIKNTIRQLNQVIEQNYQRHLAQLGYVQTTDLFNHHAKANKTSIIAGSTSTATEQRGTFREDFYKAIEEYDFVGEGILRDYQIEAMQNIPKQRKPLARIIMAPGSGKTLQQILMAQFAFQVMEPGQHVFIVTPHIQLVKQFYADFLEYNAKEGVLFVPSELVLQVSSDPQSVSVGALKLNKVFKEKKSVVICCEDSFKAIMADEELMESAAIILLDEYHDYKRTVEQLVDNVDFAKTLVVGSSATPPQADVIQDTLYTYSLKEALNGEFHAGIVAAHFNKDFSDRNLKELVQCLPGILKNQYHPGMGEDLQTLDKTKGIIYLPSIVWCEKTKALLEHHGIEAHCIHSSNPDSDHELQEFVHGKKPGVLLAVRKLRFGFDCRDLAWEIIARKPSSKEPEQDIEQMLGRVIRVHDDKIGLVITFRDLYKKYVKSIVEQQNRPLKVWNDCLAHELEYVADPQDPQNCEVRDPDVEEGVRFFSKGRKRTYSEVTDDISAMALSDDESAMEVDDEDTQYICTDSKRRRII